MTNRRPATGRVVSEAGTYTALGAYTKLYVVRYTKTKAAKSA